MYKYDNITAPNIPKSIFLRLYLFEKGNSEGHIFSIQNKIYNIKSYNTKLR